MTKSREVFPQRLSRVPFPDGTAGFWRTGWVSVARRFFLGALISTLPAIAAVCPSAGKAVMGVEPQILIDATCEDPGFNEKNFFIDKVSQAILTVKGTGQQIQPYHCPSRREVAISSEAILAEPVLRCRVPAAAEPKLHR